MGRKIEKESHGSCPLSNCLMYNYFKNIPKLSDTHSRMFYLFYCRNTFGVGPKINTSWQQEMTISANAESSDGGVLVHVQVGKEFPDMRQNETRMKFIRVRDAAAGQAQGRTNIEQGSLVHFYTQGSRSGIGVFVNHLLIGWGQHPIQE